MADAKLRTSIRKLEELGAKRAIEDLVKFFEEKIGEIPERIDLLREQIEEESLRVKGIDLLVSNLRRAAEEVKKIQKDFQLQVDEAKAILHTNRRLIKELSELRSETERRIDEIPRLLDKVRVKAGFIAREWGEKKMRALHEELTNQMKSLRYDLGEQEKQIKDFRNKAESLLASYSKYEKELERIHTASRERIDELSSALTKLEKEKLENLSKGFVEKINGLEEKISEIKQELPTELGTRVAKLEDQVMLLAKEMANLRNLPSRLYELELKIEEKRPKKLEMLLEEKESIQSVLSMLKEQYERGLLSKEVYEEETSESPRRLEEVEEQIKAFK